MKSYNSITQIRIQLILTFLSYGWAVQYVEGCQALDLFYGLQVCVIQVFAVYFTLPTIKLTKDRKSSYLSLS